MILKNKNILLGVTSSVAVYKSLELIRLYIKAGATVRVVATQSALKFISEILFEAISQNKVLVNSNESWDRQNEYNHISIGKKADIFVIAPISANSINKLASGIADNLLLQTALAYPKRVLLAPSANTNMINNPITIQNITKLKKLNYKIISPQTKELACGDVGDGALADVQEIFHRTCKELLKTKYWKNRYVVLNGGGTIENIDEVRYISNYSSGKMATALATALYYLGAKVFISSSRGYENLPNQISLSKVKSTQDMLKSMSKDVDKAKLKSKKKPYIFGVAAVSDYIPKNPKKGKLKKESIGHNWDLELIKNIDILKSLDKNGTISVGFKAELDELSAKQNAKNMLKNKKLDAVCLNILGEKNSFGSDNNSINVILRDKEKSFSGDKLEISLGILANLGKEFQDD